MKDFIKNINPEELILVEVEWVDAHSSMNPATISELKDQSVILTKSCGYLMANDKEKVVLASMLYGTNALDETLMKHYQVIPKEMVRKITKMFEPHGVTIRKSGEKIPIKYTLAYGKDGEMIFVLKDKKKVFRKKAQSRSKMQSKDLNKENPSKKGRGVTLIKEE